MNGFFGEIFDFDEPPPNDDGVPFLRMPVGVGGVEAEESPKESDALPEACCALLTRSSVRLMEACSAPGASVVRVW